MKHNARMRIIEGGGPGPRGGAASRAGHAARRRFGDRHASGELESLVKGDVARKVRLADQYRMLHKGDVARRLDLHGHGGHSRNATNITYSHRNWPVHHHYRGRISPRYAHGCFRYGYYGPSYFPRHCWYPRWTHWVDWCWRYRCNPLWDPRPVWCRPVVYIEAPVWVSWGVPVWEPLPVVPSGTWVDVEPVVVESQYDVQMLAVRFVDPGHPEERLGPRFRVWFRNNSNQPITQPFDVMLFASNDGVLRGDLPQAGVRVTAVEAGDVQSVDIRLPIEAYGAGQESPGQPAPFSTLHVLVDANRELVETSKGNNGTTLAREAVLPVDPAAFQLDPTTAAAGSEVVLAGEGFGPEPGQVLVHLGGIEMEAEILGWYDLGVQLALPNLPLAAPTKAELIVIRGDGAAANPLSITITPGVTGPELPAPPPGVPQ
ncbi:MAG: hypothetical protein ACYTG0_19875 [Planctomycetota bacterium]